MSILFDDIIRSAFSSSLPSKTDTTFKFTIAREYNSEHIFDKFFWGVLRFVPSIIGNSKCVIIAFFGFGNGFFDTIAIPENNAKNSALQNVNYCVTDFRRTPVRLQIRSL